MQGKDKEMYIGVVKFFDFFVKLENAVEWYQKIGYLLIIKAVYDLICEQGFYEKNLGVDIVMCQMLNKLLLLFIKGLCLGNMLQICVIVDEELESVWIGKKILQQVLDIVVECGNQLLCCFEKLMKF